MLPHLSFGPASPGPVFIQANGVDAYRSPHSGPIVAIRCCEELSGIARNGCVARMVCDRAIVVAKQRNLVAVEKLIITIAYRADTLPIRAERIRITAVTGGVAPHNVRGGERCHHLRSRYVGESEVVNGQLHGNDAGHGRALADCDIARVRPWRSRLRDVDIAPNALVLTGRDGEV